MSETSTIPKKNAFLAIPLILLINNITPDSIQLDNPTMKIVKNSMSENETNSKPKYISGEFGSWEDIRIARIRAIRGKYRDNLSSSDDFAKRKVEEIELEG